MNISRQNILAALLALCFFTRASATQWTGTITETITESNSSQYLVGQSFLGNYSYNNPVSDGLFVPLWLTDYANPTTTNLQGTLFLFDTADNYPIGYLGPFIMTVEMTVTNGAVSSFYREGQYGFADFWFTDFTFRYYYRKDADIQIQGTLTFSPPSADVPDNSVATLGLLLLGLMPVTAARVMRTGKNARRG